MRKIESKAAMISAIALVISIFLNVYISFENNNLEVELKYYETTFEAKQKHYSNYMIILRNSFYQTNQPIDSRILQYIDSLENEVYQIQPFFNSQEEFSIFRELNIEYTDFLLSIINYTNDERVDYYLKFRDEVQKQLYNSLFEKTSNNNLNDDSQLLVVLRREWSTILTIVGVFGTFIMVLFTKQQLAQDTKISRARFWLELESLFSKHDIIHTNLRNCGLWNDKSNFSVSEWSQIEDYMGLFEHCELMLEDNLIDPERFKEIFLYRIDNLIKNEEIYKSKLIEEKDSWSLFLRLLKRFELI